LGAPSIRRRGTIPVRLFPPKMFGATKAGVTSLWRRHDSIRLFPPNKIGREEDKRDEMPMPKMWPQLFPSLS
jgi:hypothetical protein